MFSVAIDRSILDDYKVTTTRAFKNAYKKSLYQIAMNKIPPSPQVDHERSESELFANVVTFVRVTLPYPPAPVDTPFPEIVIYEGPYDYQENKYYVIFANRHPGGGYLNKGFVRGRNLNFGMPRNGDSSRQLRLIKTVRAT